MLKPSLIVVGSLRLIYHDHFFFLFSTWGLNQSITNKLEKTMIACHMVESPKLIKQVKPKEVKKVISS